MRFLKGWVFLSFKVVCYLLEVEVGRIWKNLLVEKSGETFFL